MKTIMQTLRLSQKDAVKHMAGEEREQRLWVRKHGHADIDDAADYHIVINTALVMPETIVRLVQALLTAAS